MLLARELLEDFNLNYYNKNYFKSEMFLAFLLLMILIVEQKINESLKLAIIKLD
ncbi:hypothetical protein P344_07060 [Spiroplasma mirum ATCC 29335]|uniref:Uncharacterized protein n=1 Tax=Spiroplasma mirum ATCC 29335 TaxID=838561 RepID=W6AYA4_9MOLU|nr:hypothetical protein P344_07060 [Spiroplasma mirum ATCC 29335]